MVLDRSAQEKRLVILCLLFLTLTENHVQPYIKARHFPFLLLKIFSLFILRWRESYYSTNHTVVLHSILDRLFSRI